MKKVIAVLAMALMTNSVFAAYKAAHGYEFDSVTDDFLDWRLYLDYQF